MKKLYVIVTAALLPLMASADFSSLTFTTLAGAQHTIAADDLEITFAAGEMTARAGATELTLPTAQLAKMQFTGDATGIGATTAEADTPVSVYTADGVAAGSFSSFSAAVDALGTGIYVIVNSEGQTTKISVRK